MTSYEEDVSVFDERYIDDEIMHAIHSSQASLTPSQSMKLCDRLIESAQKTIKMRERVFEDRQRAMERRNRILETQLMMISSNDELRKGAGEKMGESARAVDESDRDDDCDEEDDLQEEKDVVQKTLEFTTNAQSTNNDAKTPGMPKIFQNEERLRRQRYEMTTPTTTTTTNNNNVINNKMSPPKGQTMDKRDDDIFSSPPFTSSSRKVLGTGAGNNDSITYSRSPLRATPIAWRNKDNILRKLQGENDSQQQQKQQTTTTATTSADDNNNNNNNNNEAKSLLLTAAERTIAQTVDDLQTLKRINDQLVKELKQMKTKRDMDEENTRKSLTEAKALHVSETQKILEDLEILKGEKVLLEKRDLKARDERDCAIKDLSQLNIRFKAIELEVNARNKEIEILRNTLKEEVEKSKNLVALAKEKSEVEASLELKIGENVELFEQTNATKKELERVQKELVEVERASKKVFASRVVTEREISDLNNSIEELREQLETEREKRILAEENVRAVETLKTDIERAASIARASFEKKVSKMQNNDGTFQEKLKIINEKRAKQTSEAKKALEDMTNQCRQAVEKAEKLDQELTSTANELNEVTSECANAKIRQSENMQKYLKATEEKNKLEERIRELELDNARVPGLEFAADAANEEVKEMRKKILEDAAKYSDLEQSEFQLREIIDRGRKETLKLIERGKKAEQEMHKYEAMSDDLKEKIEHIELNEAMLQKENNEFKEELAKAENVQAKLRDSFKEDLAKAEDAQAKLRDEKEKLESELERVSAAKYELESDLASFAALENISNNSSNEHHQQTISSPSSGKAGGKAAIEKIAQKLADAEADFKWLQEEHEKLHARLKLSETDQKASRTMVIAKIKNIVMLKIRGTNLEGKLEKALAEVSRVDATVAKMTAEIAALKMKSPVGSKSFFGSSKKNKTPPAAVTTAATASVSSAMGGSSLSEKAYEKRMEGFASFEEKLSSAKLESQIEKMQEKHAEELRALEAELIELKRENLEMKKYVEQMVAKANEEVKHAVDREARVKQVAEDETKRARFERDAMSQTKLRTEVALENAAEKVRKLEIELGRKPISTVQSFKGNNKEMTPQPEKPTSSSKRVRHLIALLFIAPIVILYLVLVFVSYKLATPNLFDEFDVFPSKEINNFTNYGGYDDDDDRVSLLEEEISCSRVRHLFSMFEEALFGAAGFAYVGERCSSARNSFG